MLSSRSWLAISVAAFVAVTLAVFLGISDGKGGEPGPTVIVCVDSTTSTDEVRESYLPDLKAIASRAARAGGRFYADACGQNATGEVDWKTRKRFDDIAYGGELGEEATEGKLGEIKGKLERLVARRTVRGGTPLAEMLAVTARQCAYSGGECQIYLFTDGEWADAIVHTPKEPISSAQGEEYLDLYADKLGGLAGAEVNFIGVGHGTRIGEIRLDEARELAQALVEEAGGEMGAWTTRL